MEMILELMDQLNIESLMIIFFIILLFFASVLIYLIITAFLIRKYETRIEVLFNGEKYQELTEIAEKYLKKNLSRKDRLFIVHYLARAYGELEQPENSMIYYRKAFSMSGRNKKLQLSILDQIAKIERESGKDKEAFATSKIALDIDSNHAPALFRCAEYEFSRKKYHKAEEYLKKLLDLRPGLIDARILYGKTFYEMGFYEYALKQFKLVRQYDQDNTDLLIHLYQTLDKLKLTGEAVSRAEELLKFHYHHLTKEKKERIILYISSTLFRTRQIEKGLEDIRQYLEKPLSEEVQKELLYLYANLLWFDGQEYQAVVIYNRIFLLDKNYKDAGEIIFKYEQIVPLKQLRLYFVSTREAYYSHFHFICLKLLGSSVKENIHQGKDFFIYRWNQFYMIFYRHLYPVTDRHISDMSFIIQEQGENIENIELYCLTGVEESARTYPLVKNSRVLMDEEFLETVSALENQKSGELS